MTCECLGPHPHVSQTHSNTNKIILAILATLSAGLGTQAAWHSCTGEMSQGCWRKELNYEEWIRVSNGILVAPNKLLFILAFEGHPL